MVEARQSCRFAPPFNKCPQPFLSLSEALHILLSGSIRVASPAPWHQMTTSYFDRCPNEILVNIFWLIFDAKSTLNCRLLNVRCRECIDSSSLLQYTIKLDAWGYEDAEACSPSSYSSFFDRMRNLEKHIKSGATLDWEEHRIKIPRLGLYHLAQGLLLTLNDPFRNTITCIDLPSRGSPPGAPGSSSDSPPYFRLHHR